MSLSNSIPDYNNKKYKTKEMILVNNLLVEFRLHVDTASEILRFPVNHSNSHFVCFSYILLVKHKQ